MRIGFFLSLLTLAAVAGPTVRPVQEARQKRRARLAEFLKNDYALILGQPFTDVLQPRQEGHYLYLTGAGEPGGALLMAGKDAKPLTVPGEHAERVVREILYVRTGNPVFRQFYGLRLRADEATARRLGVESTRPAAHFPEVFASRTLATLLPREARLHLPRYAGLDHATVRELRRRILTELSKQRPDLRLPPLQSRTPWLTKNKKRVPSLDREMARLRSVKDAGEIAALRDAIAITLRAFLEALPAIRPDSSEAAVDGALLGSVRRQGAEPAYRFVVASGLHGAYPHYFRNDAPLLEGHLLVIDAGAAVDRYAADVTRTFPVSGRFTKRQRQVYQAVLEAQKAAIAEVRPGVTLGKIQLAAHKVLRQASLAKHFIHGISHHVGLDVHDPGPTRLTEGMTITVEPGVYLPGEEMGVRIEDIVLVTADGSENLTQAFPKEIDEIEKLLRDSRK